MYIDSLKNCGTSKLKGLILEKKDMAEGPMPLWQPSSTTGMLGMLGDGGRKERSTAKVSLRSPNHGVKKSRAKLSWMNPDGRHPRVLAIMYTRLCLPAITSMHYIVQPYSIYDYYCMQFSILDCKQHSVSKKMKSPTIQFLECIFGCVTPIDSVTAAIWKERAAHCQLLPLLLL